MLGGSGSSPSSCFPVPGIYVHIPFCKQACHYCDFHFTTSLANKGALVASIIREIELRKDYLDQTTIDSLYFGGGTPSLLTTEDLGLIFEALHHYFSWEKDSEVTLEANPDDINPERLKSWKALGINRLSIGLQSFNDEELTWMNRAHTAQESLSSVTQAQDAGFSNISIDLIYGSKFQTLSTWEQTLRQAIALETAHISSYNLTIEQKTQLGNKWQRGQEPAVDEGLSSQQFLLMGDLLGKADFVHYEISNFGQPGRFARHNSNYWLGKHYLGLGPSAHSFDGSSRQWNVKSNQGYVRALETQTSFFERETLSLKNRYNEYVLTRLRTIWGCDLGEINTLFGKDVADHFATGIKKIPAYFHEQKGVFTLTTTGKLKADGLAADLFLL